MTETEFDAIKKIAVVMLKSEAPHKSYNMRNNAIKERTIKPFVCKVYIDADIAPYSKYTQIPWSETSPVIVNAPRKPSLKGKSSFLWNKGGTPEQSPKKNPNEGWIDKAVLNIAKRIAEFTKGRLIT